MVDLAIAANFVRELTEEQFTPARRKPRRAQAAGLQGGQPLPARLESGQPLPARREAEPAPLDGRPDPSAREPSSRAPVTGSNRSRRAATPITRVLSRLAQLP